jgi:AcrR family transcriptional regulator
VTVLYGAQPQRRRDAQRNRTAIVQAASELMAGRGAAILVPEVARRAGVGQATVYRHFPDRDALAAAVIAHHLERLEASVKAGAGRPAMFRQLLREALHTQIEMLPLVLLVRRLATATRERYQRRMVLALSAPLRLAQHHGYVRVDLTPEDLVLLFTMVLGVAEAMDDKTAARAAADRSIDLLLDGVFRAADR